MFTEKASHEERKNLCCGPFKKGCLCVPIKWSEHKVIHNNKIYFLCKKCEYEMETEVMAANLGFLTSCPKHKW